MNKLKLNLQLFDGDGAGASAATTGAEMGEENTNQDATGNENVVSKTNQVDRKAEFEKLIKGDYKDLYHEQTQAIIDKRFKETKTYESQLSQLSPVLEMLAGKYGVDPNNIEALSKAIQDDTSFYEDEALEMGMTVEQYKQYKQMQRENQQFKKALAEQQAREQAEKTYQKWTQEAEALKVNFPSFDLQAEMQNPDFLGMLQKGIPLSHAYKVLHMDDILGGAMQYTVEQTKQQVINNIQARGNRPTENGVQSNAATITKTDVNTLTKKEREEIERRAARGEKVTF